MKKGTITLTKKPKGTITLTRKSVNVPGGASDRLIAMRPPAYLTAKKRKA